MYGYQMIEALKQRSDDTFHLKAGTLYPLLHGLEGCEDGEVSLSGRTEDGVLYLSVCDNGVGMDPERLAACLSGPGEGKAGSSIGLANVQRRILLQYGAPYGLWVDSAPGRGTCISITLPAGSGREGGLPCCAQ